MFFAVFQDIGDLVHGLGQEHDQGQGTISRQTVAFIGAAFILIHDDAFPRHKGAQVVGNGQPPRNDRSIRIRHFHLFSLPKSAPL